MKPESQRRVDQVRQCVANGECAPRHRTSKDRRRWCRGKVGVEHAWEWVGARELNFGETERCRDGDELGYRMLYQRCADCGKHARSDGRAVCHCGADMTRLPPSPEAIEKWGAKRASRGWSPTTDDGFVVGWNPVECLACGYVPTRSIPHKTVRDAAGKFVTEYKHPRVPCRCEWRQEK